MKDWVIDLESKDISSLDGKGLGVRSELVAISVAAHFVRIDILDVATWPMVRKGSQEGILDLHGIIDSGVRAGFDSYFSHVLPVTCVYSRTLNSLEDILGFCEYSKLFVGSEDKRVITYVTLCHSGQQESKSNKEFHIK